MDPATITAIGIAIISLITAVVNARMSATKTEHEALRGRVHQLETDKAALEEEREQLREELFKTREELHKARIELATVLAELKALKRQVS